MFQHVLGRRAGQTRTTCPVFQNKDIGEMDMIRIVVADDEQRSADALARLIEKEFAGEEINYRITIFTDSRELSKKLEEGEGYDIYCLDIEMPGMDGMTLAKQIRERDRQSYLLFITSHLEYAVEGYELSAYRFIPKVLLEVKLPEAFKNIKGELRERKNRPFYLIQNNLRCEKVPLDEILYLYKNGKNVVFVTEKGTNQDRASLGEVYERLDQESFIYIDRGYLVNIRHVMKVKNNEMYLRDGSSLYISRSHVQEVKARISEYWQKAGND